MSAPNPFILASDNSPALLPLLRSTQGLASTQDPHGYSLLHAAASYGHNALLRILVSEFAVDVNVKDEDGETPLFVVETVETGRILVEELGCNTEIRNEEGLTAEEKIRREGEFGAVADYLLEVRSGKGQVESSRGGVGLSEEEERPPPLPPNVTVNMGTAAEGDVPDDVDPVFRAKIEELAQREDFQGEEGQKQLRELVTEAVKGVEREEGGRDVRRRVEGAVGKNTGSRKMS